MQLLTDLTEKLNMSKPIKPEDLPLQLRGNYEQFPVIVDGNLTVAYDDADGNETVDNDDD